MRALLADTDDAAVALVQLIHRRHGGETRTKDLEFSRPSMIEHWGTGRADMAHTLAELARHAAPLAPGSFHVYDFTTARRTEGATR